MSKQPWEIKADYKKVSDIDKKADEYIKNEPFLKEGKMVESPIIFSSELENIREEAIEHRGILKENYDEAKTSASKNKNMGNQHKLNDTIDKLEENKYK